MTSGSTSGEACSRYTPTWSAKIAGSHPSGVDGRVPRRRSFDSTPRLDWGFSVARIGIVSACTRAASEPRPRSQAASAASSLRDSSADVSSTCGIRPFSASSASAVDSAMTSSVRGRLRSTCVRCAACRRSGSTASIKGIYVRTMQRNSTTPATTKIANGAWATL
jgi:hypothetical protein